MAEGCPLPCPQGEARRDPTADAGGPSCPPRSPTTVPPVLALMGSILRAHGPGLGSPCIGSGSGKLWDLSAGNLATKEEEEGPSAHAGAQLGPCPCPQSASDLLISSSPALPLLQP